MIPSPECSQAVILAKYKIKMGVRAGSLGQGPQREETRTPRKKERGQTLYLLVSSHKMVQASSCDLTGS